MAAPVRVVALGQKLVRFHNARTAFNVIHRESSSLHAVWGTTSCQPPVAGQSELRSIQPRLPSARYASQKAGAGGREKREPRHPWDFKLSPLSAQLLTSISLLSFMIYFFLLREESDVDTAIYRPIWERVPDITPDVAERMLESDKQFGIFYDDKKWVKSLEEYKKRYYLEHPEARPPQDAPPRSG
ncbi:uncharacterized protein LOC119114314 isoform X1 [Pollicipes pollicipes]|uniref:uncharacterized protein LOC119114314 isoform X1 n=1 Tax=Pollicipes pollicipes TaxID=41117 RepID=UPI0018850127|nr:uncharacterized protein LOC119114314 isoform X1 [Pollicipes pollicipes]